MYIMAPEPISTAYFINPSHQSPCLYVYPLSLLGNESVKCILPSVARQRLGKNLIAAMKTYEAIEELLDSRLLSGPYCIKGK
jgi:hypothetical protein